jgi:inorganic triphosphatase YgiF
MDGEPTEIELKFEVDPEALARLKGDPRFAPGLGAERELLSTYFDTDRRDLRNAGFTLRVRRDEGRRLQTVKSDIDGGLIRRGEWEREIAAEGEGLDLAHAMDTPLRPLLGDGGLAPELKPLFATRVRRQIGRLDQDGSQIEIAFDEGEVEGDGRRSAFSELELELKQGEPASLFALAEGLVEAAPLKLSFVSKAARGYALVDGGVRACRIKPEPPLEPATPAGQAFQAVARLCLIQFSANQRLMETARGPGAVHQIRVAIRRLRSAITSFHRVAADDSRAAVKAELEWLAAELDDARNLDVFARQAFEPAARAHHDAPGMAAFGELVLEAKARAYRRARAALESVRCRRLLLGAARWIEAGDWATSPDELHAGPRREKVSRLARRALGHRLKTVRRRGEALDQMDPFARHRLRIQVKKLRYATEFFSSLYEGSKGKARARFSAALEDLQDALGLLNDIAVGRLLAEQLLAAHPQAAYAAGLVIGLQQARQAKLIGKARKAHRRLVEADRFW